MSYKNVLITVDTNDESYKILAKGEEIARNHNAKLFIIHIDMKFEDYYTGMMNFDFDKYNEQIREHSEEELQPKLKHITYPIEESIICSGDISNKIHATIEKYDIDLLIIGHHQYSRLGEFFISTAAPLIENMPSDILLIKLD